MVVVHVDVRVAFPNRLVYPTVDLTYVQPSDLVDKNLGVNLLCAIDVAMTHKLLTNVAIYLVMRDFHRLSLDSSAMPIDNDR